jgi:hypothetical protein
VIAARLVLLTAAIVACAWFALGLRALDDQTSVTAVINGNHTITAAQARSIESTLADARVLNPDEALNILRAQVEFRTGDVPKAAAIVKGIVGREPLNVNAWLVLELMTRQIDPATNRLAQARVRALAPSVPPAP